MCYLFYLHLSQLLQMRNPISEFSKIKLNSHIEKNTSKKLMWDISNIDFYSYIPYQCTFLITILVF